MKKHKLGYKKRRFSRLKLLILLSAAIVVLLYAWSQTGKTPSSKMAWGVTYSSKAAEALKLDPRKTYAAVVSQLKPQRLRLVAYWSEIEPHPGNYDFADLDSQVKLADEANIPYMIVVGQKVPRYPECHIPDWVKRLSETDQHQKLLEYLVKVMARYDSKPGLVAWQVENEPFFKFGECPKLNTENLNQELATAQSQTQKPVVVTDSGESSLWLRASARADVFGTTVYRSVINEKTGKVFNHFIPPWIYSLRAKLVQLAHPNIKKVIVAELQGEPWANDLVNQSSGYTDQTLSFDKFKQNIEFAQKVGFSENYLWGVEWWYLQKQNGNSQYWDQAKQLFAHQ